jgi:hypothetical protein
VSAFMSLFGENFMQIKIVLLITKMIGFVMNLLVILVSFCVAYMINYNSETESIETLGPYLVFGTIAFITSKVFICNFEYVAMVVMHCNLVDQKL